MSSPLRLLLARFGFEFDENAAGRAEDRINRVAGAAIRLGETLLSSAPALGLAAFIRSQVEAGGELEEVAGRLRINATELRTWRLAAEEAGASSEAVERAIGRIGVTATRTPAAFRHLGVETRGANGELRRASDIFADTGIALNAIENDTERAARATAVFGRSGLEILRVFEGGADGIARYRDLVRRLYGTDLDRFATLSDQAGDAQAEFGLAIDAVSARLALVLLPAITRGIEAGAELAATFAEWVRTSRAAEAGMLVLSVTAVAGALSVAASWAAAAAPVLLAAAAIAAVVLVVDDLMVAADGGNSAIAILGDAILGVGGTQVVLQSLVTTFEGLAAAARAAWEVIRPIAELARTGVLGIIGTNVAVARGLVNADRGRRLDAAASAVDAGAGGSFLSGLELGTAGIPGIGTAASFLVGGARSLIRNVTTGPIVVNGTADAGETARAVRDELERSTAADDEGDAADLIPDGAS